MRLQLDWSIETTEDRGAFVKEYVKEHEGELTQANLERIAEYLLWPTAEADGIEIESATSPWQKKRKAKERSLDELYEEANETGRPVELFFDDTAIKKEVSRIERAEVAIALGAQDEAELYERVRLRDAELHATAAQWVDLWLQIDEAEYKVQNWDLANGKRKNDLPIRAELEERIALLCTFQGMPISYSKELIAEALLWEAPTYVRWKRNLVYLRTQQYALLDALPSERILSRPTASLGHSVGGIFISSIYPVEDERLLIERVLPTTFEAESQGRIIGALQRLDALEDEGSRELYIDLREEGVVRSLIEHAEELDDYLYRDSASRLDSIERTLKFFYYYIKKANLSPELTVILEMRRLKKSNREIAIKLEEEFGLTYRENYISTIYTKRVIGAIAKAAQEHVKLLNYITMGPTVFKTCSRCGEMKPRNSDYFNRRKSTSDGFKSYCREC